MNVYSAYKTIMQFGAGLVVNITWDLLTDR